jgi:hypothetical protein
MVFALQIGAASLEGGTGLLALRLLGLRGLIIIRSFGGPVI